MLPWHPLRFLSPHRAVARGYALLAFMMVMLAIGGTLLAGALAPVSATLARRQQAATILEEARRALVGRAIGAMSAFQRPGDLPRPDATDYDGRADAGCLNVARVTGFPLIASGPGVRCLGRLPWLDMGMSLSSASTVDTAGTMPWYAVSANLVDPGCLAILNSDTLTWSHAGYECGTARLPYPWLTVRDAQGAILSDRVAVVLILPGPPLPGQSRPSAPTLGRADQYLDAVTIAGITYSNADMDNDFIDGAPGAAFNDILVYITIDELMRDVEAAAAGAALAAMQASNTLHGRYPWLRPFGDPSQPATYAPAAIASHGLLPIFVEDTFYPTGFQYRIIRSGAFSYAVDVPGTVSNAVMDGFTNSARTVAQDLGQCTWTTTGSRQMRCQETLLTGLPANVAKRVVDLDFTAAENQMTYAGPSASTSPTRGFSRINISNPFVVTSAGSFTVTDFNAVGQIVGQRSLTGGRATEVAFSGVPLPLNAHLPAWFTANRWHETLYAVLAPAYTVNGPQACGACLTVGERHEVKLAVIAAGTALPGQSRPAASLAQYLEAPNDPAAGVLAPSRAPRSAAYDDQVFAP